jgi:Putative Ig domain
MLARGFGKKHSFFEPPIEMRFVDLFLIIVAALMFITVMLSVISAFVGGARVDVAPRVATSALPAALLGRPYSLTLAGVGGANPYTWSLAAGILPDGLTLDPVTGTIAGIPQKIEQVQFTIHLTDAEHRSDTREMALNVADSGQQSAPTATQIRVVSDVIILPDAVAESAYIYHFAANSGTPPYQWSLIKGQLPPGLNLTPSGEVVGTPTSDDSSWSFTVRAIDAIGNQVTQHVRMLVKAAPTALWQHILQVLDLLAHILGYIILALIFGVILFGTGPTPPTEGTTGLLRKFFKRGTR